MLTIPRPAAAISIEEPPIIPEVVQEAPRAAQGVPESVPVCVTTGAEQVTLTIRYPGTWGLGDKQVPVLLDGAQIGTGSWLKPFAFEAKTGIGRRYLELRTLLGKQLIVLELPQPGQYEVILGYSRRSSNFKLKSLVKKAGPGDTIACRSPTEPSASGVVDGRKEATAPGGAGPAGIAADGFQYVIVGIMVSWRRLPLWIRWVDWTGPAAFLISPLVLTVISAFSSGRRGYMVRSGHYVCLGKKCLAFLSTDKSNPWMVTEPVDRRQELGTSPQAVAETYPRAFFADLAEITVGPTTGSGSSESVVISHRGVSMFRASSAGHWLMRLACTHPGLCKYSADFDKEEWRAFLGHLRTLCQRA